MKRSNIKFAVFLVLSILILAFIFFNSTRSGEDSNGISTSVMNAILRVIDPAGKLDRRIVHFIVRKAAHFTEFFVLGVTLTGMMIAVAEKRSVFFSSLLLLIALLSAVSDEFIQSFTSRTSSARDVLLDFCGSVCGVAVALLIKKAIGKNRSKKQKDVSE